MRLDDLSSRQRQVVDATEAVVVVLGGPGSGKTTTALWAGRLALERQGVASWQRILFLTFSRAAVGQIARRSPVSSAAVAHGSTSRRSMRSPGA